MDLKKMAQSALNDKKKGSDFQNLVKLQNQKKKNFVNVSDLEIDDFYRTLIRKQTTQESEQLKLSISKEGIRDALVVYDRDGKLVVVDGHHRLNMAKTLGIETVPIEEMAFTNKEEARIWMLRNQLGRRNLGDAERIEIALRLTSFLEEQGTANKKRGKDLSANLHKGSKAQRVDRLKEASNIAKVSRRNVAKYKKIQESGKEALLKEVVEGKKSIHKAYSEVTQAKSVAKKAKHHKEVELIFASMQDWKNGLINDEDIKKILLKHLKK